MTSRAAKNIFYGKSYYIIFIFFSIIIAGMTWLTGADRVFYLFYTVNFANINNTVMTVFGILFAFLFTIMAILFSLNENSYFFKLIEQHERNKKDVMNYFVVSIVLLLFVFIISTFLTITYIDNTNISNADLNILISQMKGINDFLVFGLLYLTEITIVSVLMLMITFVMILRN